ncbi:hypothetical protein [Pirellula sp. SH-Sr6A]|uniref:hypothetical protein n=1 Tax=Pirellula sp. SH-Sr6A TaxID=1632865 RepID=UPI0011BA8B6E|nr:hypothetical protein [Pirellula sp. SH-Sr6A]
MKRRRHMQICKLCMLGMFAWAVPQAEYASAQIRPPILPREQAATSLVQSVTNLETELARSNATPNVRELLHLEELKRLASRAPSDLDGGSADRLRRILNDFDGFQQNRRYSSVSSLSTFKTTHSGLQSLVASLPKQGAVQEEAKRALDRTLKPRTIEKPQEPPKVRMPDRVGGARENAAARLPQIAKEHTASGSIPCLISRAPRPTGTEKRDVIAALDLLQRNEFTIPGAARLHKTFPFHELRSLASGAKIEVQSQRRLEALLAEMNALSLDPNHASAMHHEVAANLHNHLRDLVDASNVGHPYSPPTPSNDLAAVELFGTLDNYKSAKWLLRLHVVACADNDGQRHSTMTKAQIQQGVAMANKVFEPAQLRIVFDPEKDWEELKNTKINSWDLVDHDKNAAAHAASPSLHRKIVLFSAFGPDAKTPNGWAANGGTHIWLPTNGIDPPGLCHEMGHFLGQLFHTFPGDGSQLVYGDDPSKITAANVDKLIADFIYDPNRNKSGTLTEQAMDGDGFSDTPPDPGADYWGAKWPGKVCDPGYPTATVPNPKGGPPWVFTPDRANLLSYFFRCPSQPTITPQQTAAILGRIEGTVPQSDNQNLKRLIEGQTPWSSGFGDIVIVGKIRNVGSMTSVGGRTAVIESVGDAQSGNAPLGPPVTIGPLAPNDWVLVKVPMPGGLSWKGSACLKLSHGDGNQANDTLCPEPYKAPQVK